MSNNYYEMLYGPWKGLNLYEVVKNANGKTYIEGSLRGISEDLSEMSNGSWTVPFGEMKGTIFKNLSEDWQNYFRTGTQGKYDHYSKALLLVESSAKIKLTSDDVMDRYEILDLVRDATGFNYAKTSLSWMITEFQKKTKSNLMNPVGERKLPNCGGKPGAVYSKEDVIKFTNWTAERKGKVSYKFF